MPATLELEAKSEVIKPKENENQIKIDSLRTASESKTFWGANEWVAGIATTVTVIFSPFIIAQKYDINLPKTKIELISEGIVLLTGAVALFYKGYKNFEASGRIEEEIKKLQKKVNKQNRDLKPRLRK